jgi:hypothetical protein
MMSAVAGRWILEPSLSGRQGGALDGIVAGVRELPGFVRGFWARDVADPSINLTYVVVTTRRPSRPHRGQEPSPA